MKAGEYFGTRISTLKPPGEPIRNPIKALRLLNKRQWNFFGVAFFAWVVDALDYFCVSLTVTPLSVSLGVSVTDITWGITLVLMLRSVGAITFGLLGDRFGRKWLLIANLTIFVLLEIGLGFVQTYSQFLGVRAVFGIAMGGLYGNAAATALEDAPVEARGIISGIFQQGYAFGYLLAVAFEYALVPNTPQTWRSLYWFTAGLSVPVIVWRLFLPETDTFLKLHDAKESSLEFDSPTKIFIRDAKLAVRQYWLIFLYMVLMMSFCNFASHGSQDLYPTLLSNSLGFSAQKVAITNSVANLGALCGGTLMGYASDYLGRRLTIIICCVLGGALIYPWAFLLSNGIMAGAFFEQFFVQGLWGVVPIHLTELSPEHLRAFCVGTAYQIGNLVSSASSTIESRIGERFPVPGTTFYNYSQVMAIFMGCVYAGLIIVMLLGPERKNRAMYIGEGHHHRHEKAGASFDDDHDNTKEAANRV